MCLIRSRKINIIADSSENDDDGTLGGLKELQLELKNLELRNHVQRWRQRFYREIRQKEGLHRVHVRASHSQAIDSNSETWSF